jgi:hypothetical protein
VSPSDSEVLVLSAVTIQISFCSVSHRPSFFSLFELVWRKRSPVAVANIDQTKSTFGDENKSKIIKYRD